MTQAQPWIVTASPDRPVADIAREVAQAGLAVEQVLEAIGCVVARGGDAAAERARRIPGVVDVSRSGPVDIGPPDADIS
ncbi:MAG TPA: hypothetical protein VFZ93_13935 [Albitalea sp.]